MKNVIKILHLSDLRFGIENTPEIELPFNFAQGRKLIFEDLIDKMTDYCRTNTIDVLIISGDIGYFAVDEEYKDFELWLLELLKAIKLDKHRVIICPGNHDFNRNTSVEIITKDNKEQLLSIDKIRNRTEPFDAFQSMCNRLEIPILTNSSIDNGDGKNANYLYGYHFIEELGLLCVVLNSAWNEVKDMSNESRWLGKSTVIDMELLAKKIKRGNQNLVTIAVFHHPLSYLNPEDSSEEYGNTDTSYQHLANFISIILNGHSKGGMQRPTSIANGIKIFRSGAVHNSDTKLFEFEIIELNTQMWSYELYAGKYKDCSWEIEPFDTTAGALDNYFSYGQQAVNAMTKSLIQGIPKETLEKLAPIASSIYMLLMEMHKNNRENNEFVQEQKLKNHNNQEEKTDHVKE